MTDNERSTSNDNDGDIRRLLALAGPRLQPPAELEARVRAATLAAVDVLPDPADQKAEAATRPRRVWAVAATLLFALSAGYLTTRGTDVGPAGQILFATGGYTVRGADTQSADLLGGSIVRTSDSGRLLLGLGRERTLRMDQGTSLTLHSDAEIWLHSGRIYIDADGADAVTVVTPYASVTDVGTQFEVVVEGERLTVATREGQVDVRLGERSIRSVAGPGQGEELSIDGLSLTSRMNIPIVGERWQWTQVSRPDFSLAGRPVHDYLVWASRESGRVLRYASKLAEQQAGILTLGGQGEADADLDSVAKVLGVTNAFELLAGPSHELNVGLRAD